MNSQAADNGANVAKPARSIVGSDDLILVTGSNGFIGVHVVETLLAYGFTRIRCLVRSRANNTERLFEVIRRFPSAAIEVVEGNLRSRDDADRAARDAKLVFHLAAGIEKSFAGCTLNTVVTTRNLLESLCRTRCLQRFVNVSSLAVYSSSGLRRRSVVDETYPLETEHADRNEPYSYAKVKQDEMVREYATTHGLPYVTVRPGAVYGPGKAEISGRVGIGTFGVFLHLGGSNRIPFTYVTNCAEAIVLAGITPGIEGQTFNVVDDGLPTSRAFMRGYARAVGRMRYISVSYSVFYLFSYLWEKYSDRSNGQLPRAFNRRRCAAYWRGQQYSNDKVKALVGWTPRVSFREGSLAYFDYVKSQRKPC